MEFKKPHEIALELIYRTENRTESSGAPAGAFPRPPSAPGWAGKRPKIAEFRSYLPPPPPQTKNQKND